MLQFGFAMFSKECVQTFKDSEPGENGTERKRLLWVFPQDSLLGKNATTLDNMDTKNN
jgi:hypothetical protein